MKKKLLLLLTIGISGLKMTSQVSYYNFSQLNAPYAEISGGTVLGNATTDDQRFVDPAKPLGDTVTIGVGLPIGFNFKYNSKVYDVFAINANGWISLGQSAQTPSVNIRSSSYNSPISATSSAPAALQDRIAGFARNLAAQGNSELRFETGGTAPNRVLTVQWKNYNRINTTAVNDTVNFQIKLYESINKIELVYGKIKLSGSVTVQAGLRGDAVTDWNSRTSATSWSASTASTAVTGTMTVSGTIFPASGLTYVYMPPFQYDAGITAINSPSTILVNGSQKIAVTIKNFGADTLKTASIGWSVNGAVQTAYSWTGKLALGFSHGPDTIGTFAFTSPGLYSIKAWASSPNANTDANLANDTLVKVVYVNGYAALPFAENFDKTWITSDLVAPSIYWSNTPATGNSSWRRYDNGASANWTTPANGAYTVSGAGGTAHSARFHSRYAAAASTGTLDAFLDFTSAGTKALKFWHINTSGTDTLSVYLSNNGGTSFNLVQKIANSATWTPYFIPLGTSTANNTILRFSVTNITSGTGQTDVGLDSVRVYLLPANDAGLTAITSPSTPAVPGANPMVVTVKNYGASNLTSASIGWSVDGTLQTAYSFTNAGITTGNTQGAVTIGNFNFTTAGLHTIKAWTSLPNGAADADASNDTVVKTIYVQPYASIPFLESFDNTWVNKNGTKDVPSNYWNNSPFTGDNSWRRDDDTLSAAWTSSAGNYTPGGANATAHSARFHTFDALSGSTGVLNLFVNLSAISGNKLLDFWYNNLSGDDTLSVYLSTDNGTTFSLIKKLVTATNWKRHIFNIGNSVSTTCIVKFSVTSDYGTDDAGIDQVQIYGQPKNDLTANNWTSQTTPCGLTNTESIVVNLSNTGSQPQSNIPVKYSINGGTSYVSEVVSGPLAAGANTTYTFTAKANFSTPGVYHCKFIVKAANDSIAGNDTTSLDIFSASTINNIPYVDSLDLGNKHFELSYRNNSMASHINTVGTQGTYAFDLTGGGPGNWPSGTSASTTAQQAFGYTDHLAIAKSCAINTSGITGTLFLQLDLKQTYSTGEKYSYFMVKVGNDTLADATGTKFFNPATADADPFDTKTFDMSAYAGQTFNISFVASCKYNDLNSGGAGDHAFVDNIVLSKSIIGIEEMKNKAGITISPNPSNGLVNIALNGTSGKTDITVLNIEGQAVYTQQVINEANTKLDLSGLAKGIYFVRINNDKTQAVKKLIIQ